MNITVININVTDDNNNLINFNNVDWYMTFTIKIDYKDPRPPSKYYPLDCCTERFLHSNNTNPY